MDRYPLTWPNGWKRTAPQQRVSGKFNTKTTNYSDSGITWTQANPISVYESLKRIQLELDRLGVPMGEALISTNIPTRLDGLPRSGGSEPADPGVAVYWKLKGRQECMAIDRYTSVADNLAAIAATLAALRAIKRHGGAEILERAFRGFTALPQTTSSKTWREVFGFTPRGAISADMLKERFRLLASKAHPDRGGSREEFEALIIARDQALEELNGR